MDLSTQSLTELRRLQTRVETEIRRRGETARRNLLKRMEKMAAEEGLTLADILPPATAAATPAKAGAQKRNSSTTAKKLRPASKIKYRNPANPEQGWTGHGRKPGWAIAWLAEGKSLQDLAV